MEILVFCELGMSIDVDNVRFRMCGKSQGVKEFFEK